MPWQKTSADRQRDAKTYGSPVYRRNRAIAKRRARGRCEQCGHRHPTQCDHIIPASQGGSHALANLRMLCAGDGTCKCHEAKTAQEGGGFRNGSSTRTPGDPQPRPRTNW
jgi:5-methylcytosine-specific restriction endonuclease McrA